MTKERPQNIPSSVRQRLQMQARHRMEEFHFILTRYAVERLLYRLTSSPHRDIFVLKGAMLFLVWTGQAHRPTKDLDLLGSGDPSQERFLAIFQEICVQSVENDGLVFDPATVRVEPIKEDQEYEGWRVLTVATLERARIRLQIDIGFGDAVIPVPSTVEFPTLLEFAAPVLRAYSRDTVVAEKYQAMVSLGIANSRMKDFFDLWVLACGFTFDGRTLSAAIQATFERRKTVLPVEVPLAWTPKFHDDPSKKLQWQGFIKRSKLTATDMSLAEIAIAIRDFLIPPTTALIAVIRFEKAWKPGGPWE